MSNEEIERRLGSTVLELRDKNMERRCLQKQAEGIATRLKDVLLLHEDTQYDAALAEALVALQEAGDVVQVFQDLIQVTKDIDALQRILNLGQ